METQSKKSRARPDRRAVRSKRLILQAYRELILEKPYEAITVSDIVRRADIGRATFYAHFEDRDDLSRYMFARLMAELEDEIRVSLQSDPDGRQDLLPSLALFRLAGQKKRWFRLGVTSPASGLDMLFDPLVNRLEAGLAARHGGEVGVPRKQAVTYLVSALIGLLRGWLLADTPESPEAMDAIFQSLADPTVERLLES